MLPHTRISGDDWQTPWDAIHLLRKYLDKGKKIWEPACGEGNIVNCLKQFGFKVKGTDINGTDKTDFIDPRFIGPKPKKPLGDVIVTNPPWSIKDKFFERAYELKLPFAFLCQTVALSAVERHEMFRSGGIELLILQGDYTFTQAITGKKQKFYVSWFCKGILPEKLIFAVDEQRELEQTYRVEKSNAEQKANERKAEQRGLPDRS